MEEDLYFVVIRIRAQSHGWHPDEAWKQKGGRPLLRSVGRKRRCSYHHVEERLSSKRDISRAFIVQICNRRNSDVQWEIFRLCPRDQQRTIPCMYARSELLSAMAYIRYLKCTSKKHHRLPPQNSKVISLYRVEQYSNCETDIIRTLTHIAVFPVPSQH